MSAACNCEEGKHVCVDCNESFLSSGEAAAHEKRKFHPGKHWQANLPRRARDQVRRRPVRFRDDDDANASESDDAGDLSEPEDEFEEDADDVARPLVNMNNNNNNDNNDDDDDNNNNNDHIAGAQPQPLPDLPRDRERKRARIGDAPVEGGVNDDDDDGGDVDGDVPKWVRNFTNEKESTFKHVALADDFETWSCACEPKKIHKTHGKTSNIRQHVKTCPKAHPPARAPGNGTLDGFITTARTPITNELLERLIVSFITSAGAPFNVVENSEFKALVTSGKDRFELTVPSRVTVARRVNGVYKSVLDALKTSLQSAAKRQRIHISLDLWTDKRSRGYLGVNGHYFNDADQLVSPVMLFLHLPKSPENGVLSGEWLRDVLVEQLSPLFDVPADELQNVLGFVVTDGGSNVSKAARLLGGARSCFQHAMHNFLKFFTSTIREIAVAMSAANYMARYSKLSQHFAASVGSIDAGVRTRWFSFIRCAKTVYDRRKQLAAYSINDERQTVKFDVQYAVLASGGFKTLHDFVVLLQPLMRIMIDEEAEKYITSSAIVPRLLHEKANVDGMFTTARQVGQQLFLQPSNVQRWQLTFDKLFDAYLQPFTTDEEFLAATLLDRRWGVESLPAFALPAAGAALRERLDKQHNLLELARMRALQEEEERRARAAAAAALQAEPDGDNAAGPGVRAAQAGVQQHVHDDEDLDVAFGLRSRGLARARGEHAAPVLPPAHFRSVDDEILAIRGLPKLKMSANAMCYFKSDAPQKLDLARPVARELLSLPAGEAAPERDFSVALRLLGLSRHSIAPEKLGELVFIKKNKAALGLKL
jgi:hypothetical protein